MELLISRQTKLFPALKPSRRLRSTITTLLRREETGLGVEISVVLCDDPFIQSLNAEHRGFDKPTDVLSFAQEADDDEWAGPPRCRVLGDIVISLETADRQAAAAGWTLENEVILLALHGVFHLLGYDDETVAGAVEMRDKTAAVLEDCKIALPQTMAHPYFIEYN